MLRQIVKVEVVKRTNVDTCNVIDRKASIFTKNDMEWFSVPFSPGTTQYNNRSRSGNGGNYKEIELKLDISENSATGKYIVDRLDGQKVLCKMTYNDNSQVGFGTKEVPATISIKRSTKSATSSEISISAPSIMGDYIIL
ncbi:MAG: hypothetical protein ACRDDZ_05895 [Marinifilaceae bacterium]